MGCPLRNPSLFMLKLLSFKKQNCGKESNFSVKSEGLRRGQHISYTEWFLFVLSFNVAPYFQLEKLVFFM